MATTTLNETATTYQKSPTTDQPMATPTRTMTALKIVLDAMTLGKEGVETVRLHDSKECAAVLDMFQKHGHDEVDTARVYGGGSSEEYLGQLKWQERGLFIGTKLQPRKFGPTLYSHKKDDLKRGLQESLQALQTEKIELFYLHAPDRSTPYEETLEAVNELYNAGSAKRVCKRVAMVSMLRLARSVSSEALLGMAR